MCGVDGCSVGQADGHGNGSWLDVLEYGAVYVDRISWEVVASASCVSSKWECFWWQLGALVCMCTCLCRRNQRGNCVGGPESVSQVVTWFIILFCVRLWDDNGSRLSYSLFSVGGVFSSLLLVLPSPGCGGRR